MAEVQGAVVVNPGHQFVSIGNQVRMEQTRMSGKGIDEYEGKENECQTDANPLNPLRAGKVESGLLRTWVPPRLVECLRSATPLF